LFNELSDLFPRLGGRALTIERTEVLKKDRGEICPIGLPVFGGGVIFEPGDPIAVEFVNRRIDSVTLQSAFSEGS